MGRIRSWRSTDQPAQRLQSVEVAQAEALLRKWGGWSGDRLGNSGGFFRDEQLPQRVDVLIRGEAFSPKMRVLLLGRYASAANPSAVCNEAGIVRREFDDWVARAVAYFAEQWATNNSPNNRLTRRRTST